MKLADGIYLIIQLYFQFLRCVNQNQIAMKKFYGNIPRNQITLRKEASTPEDVLTRQHEMQSNYSLYFNAGITYTFSSIYNNVVNPRFE